MEEERKKFIMELVDDYIKNICTLEYLNHQKEIVISDRRKAKIKVILKYIAPYFITSYLACFSTKFLFNEFPFSFSDDKVYEITIDYEYSAGWHMKTFDKTEEEYDVKYLNLEYVSPWSETEDGLFEKITTVYSLPDESFLKDDLMQLSKQELDDLFTIYDIVVKKETTIPEDDTNDLFKYGVFLNYQNKTGNYTFLKDTFLKEAVVDISYLLFVILTSAFLNRKTKIKDKFAKIDETYDYKDQSTYYIDKMLDIQKNNLQILLGDDGFSQYIPSNSKTLKKKMGSDVK